MPMFEFLEKNNHLIKRNCIQESIKITHLTLSEELPENHIPFYRNKEPRKQVCKKCEEDKRRGSIVKIFQNTESVTKHLLRNHQSTKNNFPTFEEYFGVLEKIAIRLEKGESLESIPEVIIWNILVK